MRQTREFKEIWSEVKDRGKVRMKDKKERRRNNVHFADKEEGRDAVTFYLDPPS